MLIGYQDSLLSTSQACGDDLWLKDQCLLLIGRELVYLIFFDGAQGGVVARLDQTSDSISSLISHELELSVFCLVRVCKHLISVLMQRRD